MSERLADAPRPGAPATFTLEQITQLYALACAPPEHSGRPISHWTPPELADELVKQAPCGADQWSPCRAFVSRSRTETAPESLLASSPPTRTLPPKSKTSARSTNKRLRGPNVGR
ncbi:helix-turn-helix domain-containing protein [Leptothermofonsia sp. ETS-13]|uniref:helix-turn-helix domain-containing protein n=1 Tax=Leptothermofonsia sp. ETS-13 TaxID=3035696 RepID=UPI003BA22751